MQTKLNDDACNAWSFFLEQNTYSLKKFEIFLIFSDFWKLGMLQSTTLSAGEWRWDKDQNVCPWSPLGWCSRSSSSKERKQGIRQNAKVIEVWDENFKRNLVTFWYLENNIFGQPILFQS